MAITVAQNGTRFAWTSDRTEAALLASCFTRLHRIRVDASAAFGGALLLAEDELTDSDNAAR